MTETATPTIDRVCRLVKSATGENYGSGGYTHIVFTQDEGYSGSRNAFEQFRKRGYSGHVVDNGRVECSISDYKRFVKWPNA